MECGRLLHVIETVHVVKICELRGLYMPGPRPTIMSSWSVGSNPYASVAIGSGW